MHKHRHSVLLVAAGCFAACSVAPTQEEVDAQVTQATGQQLPDIPLNSESVEPIQVGWIESFGDPVLSELVEEAQSNNRNLAAAAANVDRARALAQQAGANLAPQVQATAGGSRAGISDSGVPAANELALGLQVSWEADVWGRIRSGAAAAAASAQAVEADYRFAQYSLAANTAKTYFTAIEANIQTDILQETVEILEETLRIVQLRFENGLASQQDVSLARSDLASTRERLVAIEGSYRDALRALEVLLGRYPAAELDVRTTLPAAPPTPPVGLQSELLERRPDVIAAERRVASAFNATAQARAARLPALSLTGNLGGASSSLSDLLDPGNVTWRLGTSLLAPIFDGGQRRANVEIANAEQEQALASYGQTALDAFSELETALDQGRIAELRSAELQDAVTAAEDAYRIADLRYREGESDLLDALTIQQRVIAASQNFASVRRALLEQRVNLHLALGGSW